MNTKEIKQTITQLKEERTKIDSAISALSKLLVEDHLTKYAHKVQHAEVKKLYSTKGEHSASHNKRETLLTIIREHGPIQSMNLRAISGIPGKLLIYHLNSLKGRGRIQSERRGKAGGLWWSIKNG